MDIKINTWLIKVTVYSRSLSSGSIFLEFTIMNSEVRPEITAVLQRRNRAVGQEEHGKQRAGRLKALEVNYPHSLHPREAFIYPKRR